MASISIVTTLYRSQDFVSSFYERVTKAAEAITPDLEVIFVDDCSPDQSCEVVKEIIQHDGRVQLVELSRNFGHHKAILAGLAQAQGDLVFLVDCDLEEKPELLGDFYPLIATQPDIDVVYGYISKRRGGMVERLSGHLFYKLINLLSDVPIPENVLIARLMRRSYVQSLLRFNETHVFLGGLMQLAGYRQIGVAVQKGYKGSTTYTFVRKLSQLGDAVLSFSNKPLVYISVLGIVLSLTSFCFSVALLLAKILNYQVLPGWTSLMVSLWFLGGLIITSIGFVGLYVGKIFIQVKERPNTIIKRVTTRDRDERQGR